MKNNKVKAKKGMTLIEVIISVALLSILIVPLSGLVMSSLKNNISAEYRQKASYIGQKVLEELKAYDKITLKNDAGKKYFELLDGDEIIQDLKEDSTGNTFKGNFERTIYGGSSESVGKNEGIHTIEVELKKDINFIYDNVNNLAKNNNSAFILNFLRDSSNNNIIKIKDNPDNSYAISNELIMELDKNSNNLIVYKKNESTPLVTVNKTNVDNNTIVLYIKEGFSQNINIEFKNNTEETVEIHLISGDNNYSKFKIYSSIGDVILYEEKQIEENPVADMYNYKVKVKDRENNILFEGSSSKNVNIE
ncbi:MULTISPECIES: prepilin-type N-terminal cleavage/methylation domain-containing protein [Clostridium]|jgi:prepilin-type N-terminal cleavage/methylation domain-containing protein|uniref:Prepilin-type N-terminal cleavage/methylation domain-containing protein n=3 Tax=Clostridium tertium TaxID=1559 RepID=A0A9X3XIZ4_9CLOT|nr:MULTISPECIES: prepilin-type N-terminal cleavage/methylation domain-containing protein [Clostridium]EEH96592.1 prepilin-type N-terminal cleavage/methylation domain-containing protein [Clostridium sp. 7_2_43FAA]MDB1935315.1 prepilin-type N-terminal cleavage/methylation domain-containing protein [Clostridium tertium]MDB1939038.1 prepilin-type N-terminal cleavage/methylation domain-containing protein [Clostridium tertium]MDB1939349.1 prepilin-type N-terminal cleavage/methylation domain-containin